MNAGTAEIETPSGKGAGQENFPVGSFLLPARLRPHVACFYAFARAIDDIADNANLEPGDKVRRLEAMRRGLTGTATAGDAGLEKALAIRESLDATGITTQHCEDLISAFKQDAVKLRYANWAELIDYCNRSAAPVGRYLLDLHGENTGDYPWSDALCNALQVINHLQDCTQDLADLDRVYLPQDWLSEEGTTTNALRDTASSPGLRRVLDRCLDGTRELLNDARKLPGTLGSRRLALESAIIVRIAERLTGELSHRDPVAERVELTKPQALRCAAAGMLWVLMGARPTTLSSPGGGVMRK